MQDKINKYLDIIAANIKILREKSDISQEILAEKTNLSREFINRVENKKERVSLRTLLTISIVLDIAPEEFFKQ